jgi:spore germination cell wall hydrolase CwlJ-like protein
MGIRGCVRTPSFQTGEDMFKSKIFLSIMLGLFFVTLGYVASVKKFDKPLIISEKLLTKETKKNVQCLAENIYFESAYEPEKGRVAVAFVTLNRVKSGLYPDNICDVVKQRTAQVCQFSWYCEKHKRVRNWDAYLEAQRIALFVYANYERLDDPSRGALFYHADYVRPNWKNMQKTAVIGRHIFYIKKDTL